MAFLNWRYQAESLIEPSRTTVEFRNTRLRVPIPMPSHKVLSMSELA